jgi:signal transduction histidine kinase
MSQEENQDNNENQEERTIDDQEEIENANQIMKQVIELEKQNKREKKDFLEGTMHTIEVLNEALDTYAKVLEQRADVYGETSYACGPVAALYGRALLKKAILENNSIMFSKVTKVLRMYFVDW